MIVKIPTKKKDVKGQENYCACIILRRITTKNYNQIVGYTSINPEKIKLHVKYFYLIILKSIKTKGIKLGIWEYANINLFMF